MARGFSEWMSSVRERRRARYLERAGVPLDRGERPSTSSFGFQLLALVVVAVLAVMTFLLSYYAAS
jgi:hypothetical protein